MNYRFLAPTAILYTEGNIQNPGTLLVEKEKQILIQEDDVCRVSGGGYIVLDFGQEYRGGLRVLTHEVTDNYTVRIRLGESVSECFAEIGQQGATNDHAPRDFSMYLPLLSDTMRMGSGYRFMRIDFPTEGWINLKNIYLVAEEYETPAPRRFEAQSELHRRIFDTARRTVDLCTGDYVWDGIKRDRLVWVGDMYPEMLALTALYGRCEALERSLDVIIRREAPLGKWMNTFPTYSLWGIAILAEYAHRTDSYTFAAQYSDYLAGLARQIDGVIGEDGTLNLPFFFFDWPSHETEEEHDGCRALVYFMLKAARPLFVRLGLSCEALDSIQSKISKMPIHARRFKQIAALKYLATGEIDEEEKALLLGGGASGISTFTSYYVLKAVALLDSPKTAIRLMEDYYGAMLDLGATTFFEDFDIAWADGSCPITRLPKEGERDFHADHGAFCYKGLRHSLCHGWSAGVIEFMYEYCNNCK